MAASPDSIPFSGGGGTNSPQPDSGFNNTNSFNPPENDPELVDPADKYICPLHKGLLRNPVQTLCGHRLCRECVIYYLGNEASKPCPVPDDEVQEVSLESIYPDPGFQREIKRLLVYCCHKIRGCNRKIQYREYEDHIKGCSYRPVECKHKQRGCLADIAYNALDQHIDLCDFRPMSCHLCGQEFNAKDIKNHELNHCPEGNVDCPYKCGLKKLKRRELDDHKLVCPLKPSECQYKALGCDFTGDKSAVENHEKNVFKHFDYMVTFLCNLEVTWNEAESDIRKQLDHLKKSQETSLKNVNKDFKLKMVGHTEKILQGHKKVETVSQAVEELQKEIFELKTAIDHLKNSGAQTRYDQPQMSRMEIRLAEMDLRFQMIETANYDGTLLWKIRDFSIRRRDAVQGRTVSLYSQPFYSSRFGYKMCARVYLNGDGIGKGSHLSLYFVVMKGEYDALLPWPFGLKITLMLLDQSPQKRHMKDEFMPDPSSTSFHRPQIADMNVASGCPLFVAHSQLDDARNQYIKDDMLFIKVSVDCSQLPRI